MSSTAFRLGRFIHPEDNEDTPEIGVEDHEEKTRLPRKLNLYDAVAGRYTNGWYVERGSLIALTPAEVLFREKNAPERTAEDDFYEADRHLSPPQILPDSDFLKSIHTFSADYYSGTAQNGGKGDFKTMNGTALIAMGILLEESLREALGENGDMAFVEGEPVTDDEGKKTSNPNTSSRSLRTAPRSMIAPRRKLRPYRYKKKRQKTNHGDVDAWIY